VTAGLRPAHPAGLADLAELVRAPAALTVPGDVLAGAVAAGGVRPLRTAGLAASSVCMYWAGMALNDWADRRLDAIERPERPIPSGRVPAGAALGLAAGLTLAGMGLAGLAGRGPGLRTSAVLGAVVWGYDLALKNTPAGPVAMAAARSLDVLVGAGSERRRALAPAVAIGAHILGVTTVSLGEVHGGTPAAPRVALGTTAAVCAATIAGSENDRVSRLAGRMVTTGLAALFAGQVVPAQLAAAREPSPGRMRVAVGAGIHGLVPLQAAWCARAGAPRLGAGLIAALPLARRLARKVSPT
jgi:4-hydroxybenzoate polyprenyltransferase